MRVIFKLYWKKNALKRNEITRLNFQFSNISNWAMAKRKFWKHCFKQFFTQKIFVKEWNLRQILVTIPFCAALHRLPTPELESHLKKMKHPQVVSICLDMASQLRSLEKLLCVQQQHHHSVRISEKSFHKLATGSL